MANETMLSLLAKQVETQPDAIWLRDLFASGSDTWTWRQANGEIQAVANWIAKTFGSGRNISILSKNRAHWILADMAILASANVSVPLFTTQSVEVTDYVLKFAGIDLIFVGQSENWDRMSDTISDQTVIVTLPGVEIDRDSLRWSDLVQEFAGQSVDVTSAPEDMVSIVFTSGTTGLPKGVVQNHNSMILPVERCASMLELEANPFLISYLPLSHIAERQAIEVHSLHLGGEIAFIESMATLVRDLQRTSPTFFFGAPRVWESLQQGIYQFFGGREAFETAMETDKENVAIKARAFLGLEKIDKMLSGAAPLSTSLLSFYDDLGITVLEAFGQTEAMSVIGNRIDDRKIGSIGKPIGDVEARISDEGELLIRGSGIAAGYYKQPDKTAETFVHGWVRTGDRARVDDDGFYFLTGRMKDYFKTVHGKYVAPVQIEDSFAQSPFVDQLCLVGRGCSKTAMVCVLSEEGAALSSQDLISALKKTALSINEGPVEKHARIGVVLIASDPWTIDNGFMTTTLKLKRASIDDAFLETAEPLASIAAKNKEIVVEWV